jgi:HD-like signal output (HDOD) protein
MSTTHYRIIFNGLKNDTLTDNLISYMKKGLGLSEREIKNLVLSPPRVLRHGEKKESAFAVSRLVEEYGGDVTLEAAEHDETLPFSVSSVNHRRICSEMKKAVMGFFRLTLISARIVPNNDGKPFQSLLSEGWEEKIETRVSGCAVVLVMDETRFLVLDFFSKDQNEYNRLAKFDAACHDLFGDKATVFRGLSHFPEHGTTVTELILHAEKTAAQVTAPAGDPESKTDAENRLSLKSIIKDGESAMDLFHQMLIGSRGKTFKWLTERSLDELWHGLGLLPKVRQREFLYRLPLDSPLIPGLEEAIRKNRKPDDKNASERLTEEFLIKLSGFDHDGQLDQLKQEVKAALKKVESFPTLSKVVVAIIDIAKKPDSSLEELSAVIQNDPALTLSILKMVNSAFYGYRQKVDTIERAVLILGRDEIVNLVLGLGAMKAIDIKNHRGLYQPKALWHHLMGTALICRYLYKRFNKKDDPVLFTAGLLHDFGKIFLVEHYPDIYGKLHLESCELDIPLYELEEECFGINHAMIGKHVGANWNLPEPLIQAAAFHHQPFFATDHAVLAAIIGFADILYHQCFPADDIRESAPHSPPSLTYGHWQILKEACHGIAHDDMDAIARGALDYIRENDQIFSILA